MRTILATLHSKFIHNSLALPCLAAYCGNDCGELLIREFTVHEPRESILSLLLAENPDVVTFSVYIWNRSETLNLVDALAELYKEESRFVTILTIFSGLNLFISLLGIFGMARLDTERRTREVGIRKVMGAESSHVLNRFVYEYILLTLLAALFAFPGGYLLMTKWLSNFEYHGRISIAVFIVSGALSLLVVVATVAWQVWKAANSNPIEAIRYE